jgi:hypothetical protein
MELPDDQKVLATLQIQFDFRYFPDGHNVDQISRSRAFGCRPHTFAIWGRP